MKYQFLHPRFDGERFADHTIPLEVARDLAAYETLLIELAKCLFLKDHPERQRVTRGFSSDFQLHLERVDAGSARPLLSVVTAGVLALGGVNVYFDQARDLIAECIAAPDGQLPDRFPKELLFHFNQLGRSLREGEKMEMELPGGGTATLTPERRKHLVLAADQVYQRPVELSGTIEEVDWEKSTFRMRLLDGSKVIVPMPESFHTHARKLGGRHRHQITVSAVGAYDSWDRLQKIVATDSFETQEDFELSAKFDELRSLSDGWFDGGGIAPQKDKLDLVAARLIGRFPEKVPFPAIVPTPEGNLLFEWEGSGSPSVDLYLSDLKAEFHMFQPDMTDIEREFDLSSDNSWSEFLAFLTQNIPYQKA